MKEGCGLRSGGLQQDHTLLYVSVDGALCSVGCVCVCVSKGRQIDIAR